MTGFPLLAPFQAVRKPTQRRTSLYSGPTWTDQVISRGGPRSALGDRLTGEADDRRAGRVGGAPEETTAHLTQKELDCPGARITQHLRARHDRREAGSTQAHPGPTQKYINSAGARVGCPGTRGRRRWSRPPRAARPRRCCLAYLHLRNNCVILIIVTPGQSHPSESHTGEDSRS